MRKLLTLIALITAVTLSARSPITPRISIFADHISTIANQEKITFREAAQKIKALGYSGIDAWIHISPERLQVLDEVGFEHASAIMALDYLKDDQKDVEDKAIAFMKKNGFPRVLIVPALLPEQCPDELLNKVLRKLDAFSRRCHKEGITATIEDYDNPRSPCYNTVAIDKMFKAAKRLRHTFDTGNYLFCGEDVVQAMNHFRKRIAHVHLKDRVALSDVRSPAIGTGIVPMKEIITGLLKQGYKGWFCVEYFGSSNMLKDAETSIRNVLSIYESLNTRN